MLLADVHGSVTVEACVLALLQVPLQGAGQMFVPVRFGACVLVPMRDVYGSLNFGACVLVLLQQGAAGRCLWQCVVLVSCCPQIFFVMWGLCWRNSLGDAT